MHRMPQCIGHRGGIISLVKIDNIMKASESHCFIDSKSFKISDIEERLIVTSQKYKSWLSHAPYLTKAKGIEVDDMTILKPMYSIDYSENFNAVNASFLSE